MQGCEEYLYLLNISALNRLKLGDCETALAIERHIRSALEHSAGGTWQLKYINSLNLARLHKRMKQPRIAEHYYREAFATSLGDRSESDAIYMNVCQARLDENRGRYAKAYESWLRAALYWVSSPVPEAIARRVREAILGSEKWTTGNVHDNVSAALESHLTVNANASGLHREARAIATADADVAPTFARAGALEAINSSGTWHALLVAARWVLGTAEETRPAISSGANRHLRSVLSGLLPAVIPQKPTGRLLTIMVDDRLGRDLPASEAELFEVCLRLNVRSLVIKGRSLHFEKVLHQLQGLLHIRFSDAVDRVELGPTEVLVTFKRYRECLKLSGDDGNILRAIREAESTAARTCRSVLKTAQIPWESLRDLERSRIIDLYLPPEVTISSLRRRDG
jgi:hypothetical protein